MTYGPVPQPAPVRAPPPALGGLGPTLRRLAAAQGSWPPGRPEHVVRVGGDPAARPVLLGKPGPGDAADRLAGGAAEADRLVDGGADLVVVAGGGPDGPALLVLATLLDLEPVAAVGTVGDPSWAGLVAGVRDGLRRTRAVAADPVAVLDAAEAPGVAALAGLLARCASRRTPALLSGATDVWAAAVVAARLAPGSADWLLAGCSPARAAAAAAVAELACEPLLGLRLDAPLGAELALGVLLQAVELARA